MELKNLKIEGCRGCQLFKRICFDFIVYKIEKCPCKECLIKNICLTHCEQYMDLYNEKNETTQYKKRF